MISAPPPFDAAALPVTSFPAPAPAPAEAAPPPPPSRKREPDLSAVIFHPPSPRVPAFPDAKFFLPNSQPLLLTLSREALMHDLFGDEETGVFLYPRTGAQVLTLLWLCAHAPEAWETPVPLAEGRGVAPLYLQPLALLRRAARWADDTLPGVPLGDLRTLALELWLHHQGAAVERDDADDPAPASASASASGEQKKTDPPGANPSPAPVSPTDSTSASGFSAAGTPPAGSTSSTSSPSAPPTPPSTAG